MAVLLSSVEQGPTRDEPTPDDIFLTHQLVETYGLLIKLTGNAGTLAERYVSCNCIEITQMFKWRKVMRFHFSYHHSNSLLERTREEWRDVREKQDKAYEAYGMDNAVSADLDRITLWCRLNNKKHCTSAFPYTPQ